MPKIFIDAGHGGKDSGAIGNDLHEKDVVLDIALRIKEDLLIFKDTQVLLSREKNEFLTLKERTDKANSWGADILYQSITIASKKKPPKALNHLFIMVLFLQERLLFKMFYTLKFCKQWALKLKIGARSEQIFMYCVNLI